MTRVGVHAVQSEGELGGRKGYDSYRGVSMDM